MWHSDKDNMCERTVEKPEGNGPWEWKWEDDKEIHLKKIGILM
jgi:hypothetical protein